jgi:putative phage-type endonuclease
MKPELLAKTDGLTRQEWLAIRRKGIGGSDAAAICGLDPYRGALSVYLSKVGQTPDADPNEYMEWGNILETPIAEAFAQKTGYKIRKSNYILQHPEYPFMLANVDRMVKDEDEADEGILEVKNVGEYKAEEWADGAIPESHQIQGQHYMAVTGAGYVWFAPLIGGNRLRPVKLVRSERMIASLIKIESDFWHKVETKTPPPIDGSTDATKVLKFTYPTSTEQSIEIEESLYDQFVSTRQRRIEAELEERTLENEIKSQMKEAGAARIPGNPKPVFTWRGTVTRRVNLALLEQAEPEICAKYITESTSRRFLARGN